jgi:hypothetical protein
MDKKINPWITRLALLPLGAALIIGTSAPSWAWNPSHHQEGAAQRVLEQILQARGGTPAASAG